MTCEHCLRGEAENKIISSQYMEDTIKQYDYIGIITFTGGEPSLNPQAIETFIELCKTHNVGVGSFYITTNAKQASNKFLLAIMNLYLYCDDNEEVTSLTISNDNFHENYEEVIRKLQVFKFTHLKYDDKELNYMERRGTQTMINQGYYAENYGDGRRNTPENINDVRIEEYDNSVSISEVTLYLNCNGQIILGCDWSYKNQEKHILCECSESIHDAILKQLELEVEVV